jgi:hypothetical protein
MALVPIPPHDVRRFDFRSNLIEDRQSLTVFAVIVENQGFRQLAVQFINFPWRLLAELLQRLLILLGAADTSR